KRCYETVMQLRTSSSYHHPQPRLSRIRVSEDLRKTADRLHRPLPTAQSTYPIAQEWEDLRRSRETEGFWKNPTLRRLHPRSAGGTSSYKIWTTGSHPSCLQRSTPRGEKPALPSSWSTKCCDHRARTAFERIPQWQVHHRLDFPIR